MEVSHCNLTHLVVVALEPSVSLGPDPAHVVTRVRTPALVSQDSLECVVTRVIRAFSHLTYKQTWQCIF